jgi:Holliday junction DNA helicase RuvA
MYATIEGTIAYVRDNYAVIENQGIGYKIFLGQYSLGKIAGRDRIRLFTHTYVREDTLALYGFLERSELEMFELLLSVSGIGPKAALGILSIADPKTIRSAILQKDSAILTRVSGIGKKTAARVIIDLGNKIQSVAQDDGEAATIDMEVVDALVAMGYSIFEAREAIKRIPENIRETGEKIKAALKSISKK